MDRFRNVDEVIHLKYVDNYGCYAIILFMAMLLLILLNSSRYFFAILIVLSLVLSIASLRSELEHKKTIKAWLKENQGLKIFFYPHKKGQQILIQEVIEGELSLDIARVYYKEASLIGDIKNEYILRNFFGDINLKSPKKPKFMKINKGNLEIICEMEEFNNNNLLNNNFIKELIDQMNNYV